MKPTVRKMRHSAFYGLQMVAKVGHLVPQACCKTLLPLLPMWKHLCTRPMSAANIRCNTSSSLWTLKGRIAFKLLTCEARNFSPTLNRTQHEQAAETLLCISEQGLVACNGPAIHLNLSNPYMKACPVLKWPPTLETTTPPSSQRELSVNPEPRIHGDHANAERLGAGTGLA